jgi:hypothetical protein
LNVPLLVVILGATAAVVSAGIYLTLRGFKASEVRANGNGHDTVAPPPAPAAAVSRHDHATDEQLKRFFDGKDCAMCKRPIPPVHRTGPKPGLWSPTTHDTLSWDQIPNGDVSASVEGRLPLCPACQVAESFRQRFPDHVVDRERSLRNAQSRPAI